jgi:transcriptional regulator with XRE-family HTH domain
MMIPAIPVDFDLKKLRLEANLKQADLAIRLGVKQSQVQRYEQEPDNVPLRILREWWEACGKPAAASPPDFGAPYFAVTERLRLLEDYATNQPSLAADDTSRTSLLRSTRSDASRGWCCVAASMQASRGWRTRCWARKVCPPPTNRRRG